MLVFKSPEVADTSYIVYLNPEEASTVGYNACLLCLVRKTFFPLLKMTNRVLAVVYFIVMVNSDLLPLYFSVQTVIYT